MSERVREGGEEGEAIHRRRGDHPSESELLSLGAMVVEVSLIPTVTGNEYVGQKSAA